MAQNIFPASEGERARYAMQIDFKKAYVSGICIIVNDGDILKASVVNEFGVSALSFTYNVKKDKVKILSVIGKMNRWYVKRVLKRDLREVIHQMQSGGDRYENRKLHLTYTFSPLMESER
ncbi:MAG: hypothetical protein K6E54_05965 [Bacteroidaceae bacterium]|jgi:hypothetical protein|nr:hypothetical protein [Bacteroidaceae bacterium]